MDIFNVKYNLDDWFSYKRSEVLNAILENEYGICPFSEKEEIVYEELTNDKIDKLLSKKIKMVFKGYNMYFNIYIPNNNNGPFKTFLTLVHPFAENKFNFFDDYKLIKNFCPIDELINNNFAVVLLSLNSIAEDTIYSRKTGIYNLIDDNIKDSVGLLSLWSWGTRRVLDYLGICDYIDSKKVAVIGHSRGGKTALLTGALDERVFLTISNNSGNSGAALSRNNKGERIENIMNVFPYWFSSKYKKYVNNENELPFDQHMLLGLIAPRYLYVASALKDDWADPEGELLSSKLASKFYEMYNVKGLIVPNKIKINKSYNDGHIAYHIREGEHGLTNFDWKFYMKYFNKITK